MSNNPKRPGLLRSGLIFSVFTLLSRVMGFVRDVVIANIFGASAASDAFFVAFKIPNFFRRLFAEGAFSQAFVPIFGEYQTQEDRTKLRLLVARTAGTLGGVLCLLSIVFMLAAPLVISVFAPGFIGDPSRFDLASDMLRITFPYLLLISLTALASGVLNSFDRFGVTAFTPVLLNISMLVAAIYCTQFFDPPILALAWGVFVAGVVQLLFQLPFLAKLELLSWPRWGWRDTGVQKIISLMVPALFGAAVVQVNLLVDTIIASFMRPGSVTWLYYGDRLVEFPLGIFGVALGSIILPRLSRQHASQSMDSFATTLAWALKLAWLIALPATVGLIMLAEPIVISLFQHGQFSAEDATMSAWALIAYSIGLPAFILLKVLAPGFYARQDTRTPVKIGMYAIAANIVCSLVLAIPLFLAGFHAAHAALAFGTSLAAWLQAGLLWRGLRKQGIHQPHADARTWLLKVLTASTIMGVVLWLVMSKQWQTLSILERGVGLLFTISIGAAAFTITLFALGVRPRHLRH
ncbi:MAG: murein biosynthesis integral membrane protein MurJ [Gammaproteobacteria bacterium]|nr:murein biosynthesis integral membrane protein MurJ [Gammaproteobacteria bacterium]